jgi:S-adenosylmethionine:tRNA ribosyltransferase-isomerase
MFPSSRLKKSEKILLPDNVTAELTQSGRPQKIKLSKKIGVGYFEQFGEMPLPPYIQKARSTRHETKSDRDWYQTEWAINSGSSAAPTASLHFSLEDFKKLKKIPGVLGAITGKALYENRFSLEEALKV